MKITKPKFMPLEEKLAVLFVFENGGHLSLSRYQYPGGSISYENYTYGGLPIDTILTKKARKDIEANGIDWNKTTTAKEDTMGCFEGTDADSSSFHFYYTDIVSNSDNSYRFAISLQYSGLAFIFKEMDELRNSKLL